MKRKQDKENGHLGIDEVAEVYSCSRCGGLFIPGNADHDNLFETENGRTQREGECPSCGYEKPEMEYLGSVYED